MIKFQDLIDCYCKLKDKVDNLVDNDNQTLSITGNDLSISNGNTVELPTQSLGVTKTPYRMIYASARVENNANAYVYGCGVTRVGVGLYEVRFTNPHPGDVRYVPVFGQGEDGTLRDVPKVSWIEGTLNANGFDVQITVDDNGTGADILQDNDWGFHVEYTEFNVVSDVTLT